MKYDNERLGHFADNHIIKSEIMFIGSIAKVFYEYKQLEQYNVVFYYFKNQTSPPALFQGEGDRAEGLRSFIKK